MKTTQDDPISGLPVIAFSRETCNDYYFATQKEWLETNGLGGYASSSIIGANVRRYHGLLVASLKPPTHRYVLLSKIEESVSFEGHNFELATNQYPFVIFPDGHKNIERFEYDGCPNVIYNLNGTIVKKTFLMIHGENTIIIRYRILKGTHGLILALRPLHAFREHHALAVENSALNPEVILGSNRLSIQPYTDLPPMYLYYSSGIVEKRFFWYKNTEYRKEQERGLDFSEDLFCLFYITAHLEPGDTLDIITSTEASRILSLQSDEADRLIEQELNRRQRLIVSTPINHPMAKGLALAADSFLVRRENRLQSTIAGYHWFGDWSRDTMIALPGLTLTMKKFDLAKAIIRSYAQFLSEGMLPNRFPELDTTPEYNNVDGTLWYFIAIYQYWIYTGDFELIEKELYEKLSEIIDWHIRGTRYNIKVDDDGLLSAGQEGLQLTWMDAKIGDWVVTPRIGKPVEVNALWYNALCIMKLFADKMKRPSESGRFKALAEKTKSGFNENFWNAEKNYLYDYINQNYKNTDIRPNQLFSISLPFPVLQEDRHSFVLDSVQTKLLTPFGLRTLTPDHPDYIDIYAGDVFHRDRAYHQGIVWAWLIGPFIDAYMRVHKNSEPARTFCLQLVENFMKQMNDYGIGTIAEIFDSNDTHFPKGCISHATSVAEILRALELLTRKP
jgi:predicted glycogen debranching enzyme